MRNIFQKIKILCTCLIHFHQKHPLFLKMLLNNIHKFPVFFKSLGIQLALRALNFVSISTKLIPPLLIGLITVFLLILSRLFHKNLYMSLLMLLIVYSSGIGNTVAIYMSFEMARVLIISHFPNIVSFLFFQDSNNFSISFTVFVQFLS